MKKKKKKKKKKREKRSRGWKGFWVKMRNREGTIIKIITKKENEWIRCQFEYFMVSEEEGKHTRRTTPQNKNTSTLFLEPFNPSGCICAVIK